MGRPVIGSIMHRVNPLHIYCRIIDLGFSKLTAKRLASILTYLSNLLIYGRKLT